jgi:hypothetical protein
MVGLSLKEISCSHPMGVQENKYSKHKTAQLIGNKTLIVLLPSFTFLVWSVDKVVLIEKR